MEQQEANAEQKLTQAGVMTFYKPNIDTKPTVEASPVGAILTQQQDDGEYKPIKYESRSLLDTEQRYSQTKR